MKRTRFTDERIIRILADDVLYPPRRGEANTVFQIHAAV
jgi:hypothetical protein